MVILDVSVVNVALPSIREDLGFSAVNLQWVVNAYTLTFAGFLLLGGRAADLLGRRRIFVAGMAALRARVARRRPVDQPGPAHRRARRAGAGRGRRRARHAGDHHHHLRGGLRAQPRARVLGRDGGRRRLDRRPARRRPDRAAGLAVDPLHQRPGRDPRRRRRHALHPREHARGRGRAPLRPRRRAERHRRPRAADLRHRAHGRQRLDLGRDARGRRCRPGPAGALRPHRAPRAATARPAGHLPLAHADGRQPRLLPARLRRVRDVVLRLAVPAAGARLHADRGRAELPAHDRRDHRRLDLRRAPLGAPRAGADPHASG